MGPPYRPGGGGPRHGTVNGTAHWPLRRRLVIAIVALLALFSVIVGAVSVVALDQFLVARLDGQLRGAISRSQDAVRGPDGRDASLESLLPGLGAGALGVLVVGGVPVRAGYISERGEPYSLGEEQLEALLTVRPGAAPATVGLGGGLGDYRLAAVAAGSGVTTIVGLPMAEVDETTLRLAVIIAVSAAAALAAAGAVGSVVVRLALRPLNRIGATAARVAELPLERGEVALAERVPAEDSDRSTEVGQVGAALNRMLDHVAAALSARQRSEDKVRQFVGDASHELRTPLASIRGYAELTRRAPYELPDDLRHALARIESESIRMTRLVEELLLLARLDEGERLTRQPTALAPLLADVLSDAAAAGPDHHWRWEAPEHPVTVTADRERLHQAVANLLANARAHTPPGTTVRLSVRGDGASATIRVTDDGPGIDPDLLPRLFERFVRGDPSRSRHAGSTGLGLAIVRAVVEAHGGSVTVESLPGHTSFEIVLPADPPPGRTEPAEV